MIGPYRIRLTSYFFILIFALIPIFAVEEMSRAALCGKWSGGIKSGILDHHLINEASGIEASNEFPGRLYHVNDSGGGHYFYITDTKGDKTQKIKIEGVVPKRSDFEDLSLGKCSSNKSCIFIADIGDNRKRREFVDIIVIEELEKYGHSVYPLKRLKLVYPDRPHNAEGMAVHPNGDIYLLTKEEDLNKSEAYPAKLYRLSNEKRQNSGNKEQLLEFISEIDLSYINPSGTVYGQVISAFDIAPDGKSFLVLTYENAFEFNTDLSQSGMKKPRQLIKGQDYNVIELKSLPQQESISYLPNGRSLLYNTEYHWIEVPIVRVDCLDDR